MLNHSVCMTSQQQTAICSDHFRGARIWCRRWSSVSVVTAVASPLVWKSTWWCLWRLLNHILTIPVHLHISGIAADLELRLLVLVKGKKTFCLIGIETSPRYAHLATERMSFELNLLWLWNMWSADNKVFILLCSSLCMYGCWCNFVFDFSPTSHSPRRMKSSPVILISGDINIKSFPELEAQFFIFNFVWELIGRIRRDR